MSLTSRLEVIRRVPLFAGLSAAQAVDIAQSAVIRRLRRGAVVVEKGKRCGSLFILLNGRARVLASDSRGREAVLATLGPGDCVGEMSMIDNEPHSATVRVEVQTDLLVLAQSEFARCLPDNPALSYAILRGLVRRLREANRQIESLALLDVHGRVARALLDRVETVGEVQMIRGRVSRQGLARIVGASREMVSRVMTGLESRGLIHTQADGSVIVQPHLGRLASTQGLDAPG